MVQRLGHGCGSACRAVAAVTRDPRFESSHREYIFNQLYLICIEKTKRIGKETRNGNLFKWSNPGLFCFFMLFSCDIFAEKL